MVRAQFAHHVRAEFVNQWLGRLGVFHNLCRVMAGGMEAWILSVRPCPSVSGVHHSLFGCIFNRVFI
jgi:hypothetical protein